MTCVDLRAFDTLSDFRRMKYVSTGLLLTSLYKSGIEEMIARRETARESVWPESLAVGYRSFVEQVAMQTNGRSKFEYEPVSGFAGWSVRERADPYGAVLARFRACKAVN